MMILLMMQVMMMMIIMMMMSYLGGMSVLLTAAVGVERQHWTSQIIVNIFYGVNFCYGVN